MQAGRKLMMKLGGFTPSRLRMRSLVHKALKRMRRLFMAMSRQSSRVGSLDPFLRLNTHQAMVPLANWCKGF